MWWCNPVNVAWGRQLSLCYFDHFVIVWGFFQATMPYICWFSKSRMIVNLLFGVFGPCCTKQDIWSGHLVSVTCSSTSPESSDELCAPQCWWAGPSHWQVRTFSWCYASRLVSSLVADLTVRDETGGQIIIATYRCEIQKPSNTLCFALRNTTFTLFSWCFHNEADGAIFSLWPIIVEQRKPWEDIFTQRKNAIRKCLTTLN